MKFKIYFCLFALFFKNSKCLAVNETLVISFLDKFNSYQGIIFHCDDSHNFRHFYGMQRQYFTICHLSRVDMNIEDIMRVNYHKIGAIVDTTCEETAAFFDACSSLSLFNASFNWLMLSADFNASTQLLNHQNINLDAEITLAVTDNDESNFVLYDVYNPSFKYGGENVFTEKGRFDFDRGLYFTLKGTKLEQRRDLRGITVNVAVVAEEVLANQTLLEYLESFDRPLLDAPHRHHYGLHKILAEKHNYRWVKFLQ
jgi:hypothetical protein